MFKLSSHIIQTWLTRKNKGLLKHMHTHATPFHVHSSYLSGHIFPPASHPQTPNGATMVLVGLKLMGAYFCDSPSKDLKDISSEVQVTDCMKEESWQRHQGIKKESYANLSSNCFGSKERQADPQVGPLQYIMKQHPMLSEGSAVGQRSRVRWPLLIEDRTTFWLVHSSCHRARRVDRPWRVCRMLSPPTGTYQLLGIISSNMSHTWDPVQIWRYH